MYLAFVFAYLCRWDKTLHMALVGSFALYTRKIWIYKKKLELISTRRCFKYDPSKRLYCWTCTVHINSTYFIYACGDNGFVPFSRWIHLCFCVFWCVYFVPVFFYCCCLQRIFGSFRRFGFWYVNFIVVFIISQNNWIKTMCKKCENNGTTTTFRKTIKCIAWD